MTDKTKKTLSIISAVAGIVLIVAIILSIFTCSGKKTGKGKNNSEVKEGANAPIERPVIENDYNSGEKNNFNEESFKDSEFNNLKSEDLENINDNLSDKNDIKSDDLQNEKEIQKDEKDKLSEEKNNSHNDTKLKTSGQSSKKIQNKEKKQESKKTVPAKDKLTRELEELFIKFEKSDSDGEKNKIVNQALPIAQEAINKGNDSGEAYFFKAQDFINKGDISNAESQLKKAIKFRENYLYYYYLGKMLFMKNDFNGAINAFKKSCELNMKFAPSRYNLGLSYSKVNKIDQALSSYKQAIDVKPDYEQAYLGIGRLYKQVKYYDDAIKAFDKVIEINYKNVSARMDLGVIYNERGEYPKAIKVFRDALKYSELSEIQTIIKYNLSIALYNNGDYEEALNVSKESYEEKVFVTDRIEESNLVYNYGLILETCGKYEEAVGRYKEALSINRSHLKAKINLSNLYMKQDNPDPDEVLRLLNGAYVVAPNNFEVNNNMGNAYVLKGDYKNAVIYLRNALNIHPDDEIVKQNLASSFLKAEDYENAEKVYVEIIEDEPENWQAYLDIAKVYIQLGNEEKAMYYLVYLQKNNKSFKAEEVAELLSVLKI